MRQYDTILNSYKTWPMIYQCPTDYRLLLINTCILLPLQILVKQPAKMQRKIFQSPQPTTTRVWLENNTAQALCAMCFCATRGACFICRLFYATSVPSLLSRWAWIHDERNGCWRARPAWSPLFQAALFCSKAVVTSGDELGYWWKWHAAKCS